MPTVAFLGGTRMRRRSTLERLLYLCLIPFSVSHSMTHLAIIDFPEVFGLLTNLSASSRVRRPSRSHTPLIVSPSLIVTPAIIVTPGNDVTPPHPAATRQHG